MNILYFAYGSNMKSDRFLARIPSAKIVGPACVRNKRVVTNKKSKDGSAKANLVDHEGFETWGVLYQISDSDLEKLDRIERGYIRTYLTAWTSKGNPVEVVTYTSQELADNAIAFDWYKKLILDGAKEHGLPDNYQIYLQSLPSRPDPTKKRSSS